MSCGSHEVSWRISLIVSAERGRLLIMISPCSGCTNPSMACTRVDLPEPDGPYKTTFSPGLI